MTLSSLSINRPVLATVISITIVLFGVIGFTYLGLREYPSVDPPVISVSTNYVGANADVIESQITEPLEESVNGIAGIRSLTSTSADGRSTITVEFEIGTDLEAAANDVRDKVSRAQRYLPPDADPPIVSKSDADAGFILALTIQSDKRDLLGLSEIADNIFKERLQTVPGVSRISIWGQKKYAIRINMDPNKLSAYGLTPLDVRNALNEQNLELPSGKIEGYRTELTIRTFGRLSTPDEFSDMVIRESEGIVVQLKDVAEVVYDAQNMRTLLRGNGIIPMVGAAITPLPGANYIDIADEVYDRVEQIKEDIPPDIQVGYAFDRTTTIRKAIKEVEDTIIIAFILVLLVIFMFLRDWRTTLIPIIAIPISLIGAFFVMYIFDFSINILTLLAIVLATGLVVDDAIVMMENIYRRVEGGEDPIKAAHEGSKEIYFAIISTTVTLVAVFMPIIFLQGLTGRLFREFGVVVSGSIIISTIVSLSLTPMMSSRFLKHRKRHNWLYRNTEWFFVGLTRIYNRSLRWFMQVRWIAWLITLASLGAIYWLGTHLNTELAPMEDKSSFRVVSTAPEGTSYEVMDQYVLDVLNILDTIPEKKAYISVTAPGFGASTSVNSAFVFLSLTDPSERTRSQDAIVKSIYPHIGRLNYARSFLAQEQTISVSRSLQGLPVQYVIQAPNFENLKDVIPSFMESVNSHPVFSISDLNLKFNKPELHVKIDRERALSLGVTVRDVAQTLQLLYSGQRFGYFIRDGKQYEVIGEAARNYRDEPMDLSSIYVRNNQNELIQLSNLVQLSEESNPPTLYRYNRYISATVSAGLNEGYTLGQGIDAMNDIAAETLNPSFSTALTGASKDFEESSGGLYFAFILALALIYLALAAQFESFLDPLVIMFTVPLALAGALIGLYAEGHTINIFSQIGIIVLVGIVTKNGILIVEFANQRMNTGLGVFDAVIEASTIRMRPILMTSMATVLGVSPIALALGSASTSRIPMGVAIIGGLLFSLLLTLFVIPAIYTFFNRDKQKHSMLLDEAISDNHGDENNSPDVSADDVIVDMANREWPLEYSTGLSFPQSPYPLMESEGATHKIEIEQTGKKQESPENEVKASRLKKSDSSNKKKKLKKKNKKNSDKKNNPDLGLLILFVVFINLSFSLKAQPLLTLQEAVQTGLEKNYGIQIAKVNEQIASNNNTLGNAGYLPTVTTNGLLSYTTNNARQEFFNGDTRESASAGSTSFRTGIGIQWALFEGFRREAARSRLLIQEDQSKKITHAEAQQLVTDIEMAYAGLVRLKQLVELTETSIALNLSIKDLAKQKFTIGVVSELEVLQASNQLNADSALLISQSGQMDRSKIAFNRLLGQPPDTKFQVDSVIEMQLLPNRELMIEAVKMHNPQLILLRMDEQVTGLQIKEVKSALYPTLNLNVDYNYNWSKAEVGFLLSNRTFGPVLGLSASYDIFSGRNLKKDIENVSLIQRNQQFSQKDLDEDLIAQISDIYANYQSLNYLADLEQKNIIIAEKNTRLARELYRQGQITSFEVREAILREIQNRDRLIDTQYQRKLAEIQLKMLTGQVSY
jgi:multidrug efflux pump